MSTTEELKEKITSLEKQLKSAEESSTKLVYARDRKFPILSKTEDFSDWIENIEKHVNLRYKKEEEKVMFLMEHLDTVSKLEVKFRCKIDKATLSEIVKILKDIHQPSESLVVLQQNFYSRNQHHGESLETYATELMKQLTRITDEDPKLYKDKDKIIKEKFAEGIENIALRRELKRLNDERPSLQFWELRKHSLDWEKESTRSGNTKDNETEGATSEAIGHNDLSEVVNKQQKQIDELTQTIKFMKKDEENPTTYRKPTKRPTCFFCHRKGHRKADCFKFKEYQQKKDLNSKAPRN